MLSYRLSGLSSCLGFRGKSFYLGRPIRTPNKDLVLHTSGASFLLGLSLECRRLYHGLGHIFRHTDSIPNLMVAGLCATKCVLTLLQGISYYFCTPLFAVFNLKKWKKFEKQVTEKQPKIQEKKSGAFIFHFFVFLD